MLRACISVTSDQSDQSNIDQYRTVSRAVVDTLAILHVFMSKTHVVLHLLSTSALNFQLEYIHIICFMQTHNKCLHKFCQTYLNDILIYSKTLKEHRTHMKEVLNKLREVDLQINIDKCKFKIQKISFLELLIFINDLRMNFQKQM